jgi:A/G-specific adenine glycosylase
MGGRIYQIWPEEKTRKFQDRILHWYTRHRRRLPWRSNPTPYRTWVSEVMLQQTQVQTVLPYYRRFIRRFPTVGALAASPENEVLAHWAGLGYYSRARNLHRAARKIMADRRGRFPDTLEALQELPGVGRYIAGAIFSIAFNRPDPAVDGNVRRVVSRLLCLDGKEAESICWKQAASWVPPDRPSDFNQGIMELGALVCTSLQPLCAECPVSSFCAARARGLQSVIPACRASRSQEMVRLAILVLECRGRILLVRDQEPDCIPGEWRFPTRTLRKSDTPLHVGQALAREIAKCAVALKPLPLVRHGITRYKITGYGFHATLRALPKPHDARRWFHCSEVDCFLVSSLFRKVWHAARKAEHPAIGSVSTHSEKQD